MNSKILPLTFLLSLLLLLCLPFNAISQHIEITSLSMINGQEVTNKIRNIYIGDEITLEYTGKLTSIHNLSLFINGREIQGPTLYLEEEGKVNIQLAVTEDSQEIWRSVFGGQQATRAEVTAALTLGPKGGSPYPTKIERKKVKLHLFSEWDLWKAGIVVLVVVGILFSLKNSNIIKDVNEDGSPSGWSLSRIQWFGWTLVISTSILLLWALTREIHVNSTALILLGLATGGRGIAKMFGDKQKKPESDTVKDNISNILNGSTATNKASLQRFQFLIFTVMFWVIYISSVLESWALPDYSDQPSVFLLLGLSSATYLGFKQSEKSVTT